MSTKRSPPGGGQDIGLEVVGLSRGIADSIRLTVPSSPSSTKRGSNSDASLFGWSSGDHHGKVVRTPSSIRAAAAAELNELERTHSATHLTRVLARVDPSGPLSGSSLPGSPARGSRTAGAAVPSALPGLPSSPRADGKGLGKTMPRAKTMNRTGAGPDQHADSGLPSTSMRPGELTGHPLRGGAGPASRRTISAPDSQAQSVAADSGDRSSGSHAEAWLSSGAPGHWVGNSPLEGQRSGGIHALESHRSGQSVLETRRRGLGFQVPSIEPLRSHSPEGSAEGQSLINSPKRETPNTTLHRTTIMAHRLATTAGSPRSPSTPTSHYVDANGAIRHRQPFESLIREASDEKPQVSSGGSSLVTPLNPASAIRRQVPLSASPPPSRYGSPLPSQRLNLASAPCGSDCDSPLRTFAGGPSSRPGSGRNTTSQLLVDAIRSKDHRVLASALDSLAASGGAELPGLNDRHPVTGRTALHEAVMVNNVTMVRSLLQAGANPNVAHDTMGPPLLHPAAWGESEMLVVLLEAGADVMSRDVAGHTALHYACTGGHVEAGRLLLSHGADLGALNSDGDAPLALARPDVARGLASVGGINGIRQHQRAPSAVNAAGAGASGADASASLRSLAGGSGTSGGAAAPETASSGGGHPMGRLAPPRPPRLGPKAVGPSPHKPPSGRLKPTSSRAGPSSSKAASLAVGDGADAGGGDEEENCSPPQNSSPVNSSEGVTAQEGACLRPPKLKLPQTIARRLSRGEGGGATLGDIMHSFEVEDLGIGLRLSQMGLRARTAAGAGDEGVHVHESHSHVKCDAHAHVANHGLPPPGPSAPHGRSPYKTASNTTGTDTPPGHEEASPRGNQPNANQPDTNQPSANQPSTNQPNTKQPSAIPGKDNGFGGLPVPDSNSGSITDLPTEAQDLSLDAEDPVANAAADAGGREGGGSSRRPYRSPRASIDGGAALVDPIRFGVGPPPIAAGEESEVQPMQRLWQMSGHTDPARISQAAAALAAQSGTNKSTEILMQRALLMFNESVELQTGDLQWTRGELMGEGSFGKVFAGLNQQTGELMAVKVLELVTKNGNCKENVFRQLNELKQELDLYKTLKHHNVVGYIDAQFDMRNSSLYIFLEYVPGGSIASMLERFGKFSEELVRNYTRQLLLGLEYLHGRKIVHRDVKGGNILVSRDGVVKLADFGASKAYQDPMTITDGMKSLKGSVFWMAPEVIKGIGYGRRADVWSLGCTVIEMLTGKHPWPDLENHWSAMYTIAKDEQGPPRPGGCSAEALDFLKQCLRVDHKGRPSAAEMLKHPWVASIDSKKQANS